MGRSDVMGATFHANLSSGKVAESKIAKWLMARGHYVIPVYEIEGGKHEGPRVYAKGRKLVAPDLMVFNKVGSQMMFIEAKHKSHFTWYRLNQTWQTGVDAHHFRDYLEVARQLNKKVWLLFFHDDCNPCPDDIANGCPTASPTGLFGGDIIGLEKLKDHSSDRHGRHGMVYWRHESLIRLATVDDVLDAQFAA